MKRTVIAAVVILALFIMFIQDVKAPGDYSTVTAPGADSIKCMYYSQREFMSSIPASTGNIPQLKSIGGGIVPHHLLAGTMIASLFKALSQQKPQAVIVIGPNHKGVGVKKINTGEWSWETPFGLLDSDKAIAASLMKGGKAGADKSLLEKEHSISSLVPYIEFYLPEARIVPVLLHGSVGKYEAEALGRKLGNIIKGRNYVIIASTDFSHYLTLEQADRKDEITRKAIEVSDISKISLMNNDYVDSPPSLIALLTAMKTAGTDKHYFMGHSNSARILRSSTTNTTSYFTVLFHQ